MLLKEPFAPQLYGDELVLALTPFAGSTFVARMLTVVTTLKAQQRNVLDFMTQAIVAARFAQRSPCLLPEVTTSSAQEDLPTAA